MTPDRYTGYDRILNTPRNQRLQDENEQIEHVQQLLGFDNPSLAKQLIERGVDLDALSISVDESASRFGLEKVAKFLCNRFIRKDGRIKNHKLYPAIRNGNGQ